MAGTVTDQLKRICRKMGGSDVAGSVTDLLAKIERLAGTLPDGALINSAANFYRPTKPLTRVDGSALVSGDVWVDTTNGNQGFWNGTHWLSFTEHQTKFSGLSIPSGTGPLDNTPYGDKGIFYTDLFFIINWTAGTNNGSNKHTFSLTSQNWIVGAVSTIYTPLDTFALAPASLGAKATKIAINTFLPANFASADNAVNNGLGLRFVLVATTGTPGTFTGSGALKYRYVL